MSEIYIPKKRVFRERTITTNTLQNLSASYESKWNLNPLEKTRRRNVTTARQCLLFILFSKYNQSCTHLGSITGVNHATVLHSVKAVKNGLDIKDKNFIECINNWADIFTNVVPSKRETMDELIEHITLKLNGTMLSSRSKVKILNAVAENIS